MCDTITTNTSYGSSERSYMGHNGMEDYTSEEWAAVVVERRKQVSTPGGRVVNKTEGWGTGEEGWIDGSNGAENN